MIGEHIDEPYFEELLKKGVIKLMYKNEYRVCIVEQIYKDGELYVIQF